MSRLLMLIEALFYGIIQGVTEWLPISSTGHMILFREIVHSELGLSDSFFDLFFVVIQLFSVLAVLIIFRDRFISRNMFKDVSVKKSVLHTWKIVAVGMIPLCIAGVFLEDWVENVLSGTAVIASALIFYGILFIVIEKAVRSRKAPIEKLDDITCGRAFSVGLFQILAVVPGTSRSGSTIIGAMLSGISRQASAEYSFLLAVPVMLGAGFLKVIKHILSDNLFMTPNEILFLAVGCITSFLVSMLTVRFLTGFVKKHSFIPFGIYRIILGIAVLILSLVK